MKCTSTSSGARAPIAFAAPSTAAFDDKNTEKEYGQKTMKGWSLP